jgi:LuxR family maltose regulon positive regulatory protein
MQAGDADRAARLVADLAFAGYRGDRLATIRRWLDWFDHHDLIERHPAVAVVGAWVHALGGHASAAERWADAAERGSLEGVSSDGPAFIEGGLGLLRAAMCRDGAEQARCDAELPEKLVPLASPWRATTLLLGVTNLLVGEADDANDLLVEAVEDTRRRPRAWSRWPSGPWWRSGGRTGPRPSGWPSGHARSCAMPG